MKIRSNTKNKVKKTIHKQGKESAVSKVVLFAILFFMAIFGWVSYKYYVEVEFLSSAQGFVDNSIKDFDDVFVEVEKVNSGAGTKENIEKIARKYKDIVANFTKRKAKDEASNFKEPLRKISEIETDIQILRGYVKPLLNNYRIVSSIISKIVDAEGKISDLSKDLQKINDKLSEDERMLTQKNRVELMITNLEEISFGLKGTKEGVATYPYIYDSISESLTAFERGLSYLRRDLFLTGKLSENNDEYKYKLIFLDNIETTLRTSLKEINSEAREYLELQAGLTELNTRERHLFKQFQDLRKIYYEKANAPFPTLELGYAPMIGILGGIIVILIITWFSLSRSQMKKLLKETTKLRESAEDRNKAEQEAILRLMDELADFSEGDLTVEAQVTEDSTGAIADSINFAVESMREMVVTIIRTSKEIQGATKNVSTISTLLEDSSIKQSEEINLTHETAQRMSISLDNVAENSDSSVEIAQTSVNIAKDGKKKVQETVGNMNLIRGNIQETSKHIKKLGESSQEIGDIIEIIKGITDQTNILSLNAAIQATFAGEAGRGFAVVADEIQRLSERSSNASKRIEVLIKTIQADANEAITSMEKSTQQVVSGATIAEKAGEELDKIEGVSTSLASLIINVSKATRDAADMAKRVSVMMDKLTAINERSQKEVKASVDSFGNIKTLSNELEKSVTHFKLPNEE